MFNRTRGYLRRLVAGMEERVESGVEQKDRRVAVRYAVDVPTVCRTNCALSSQRSVRIRDVSNTGISLVFDKSINQGTLLTIDLPGHPGRHATTVLAYVKHSTAQQDGSWVVGCIFANELDDGALASFGVERASAKAEDKRRWERKQPRHGKAVLQVASSLEQPRQSAEVLNLSPLGAGLVVAERIEPSTLLNLELQGSPPYPPLMILASVVYVSPHAESGWVIGCSFIRELSDEDLAHLV